MAMEIGAIQVPGADIGATQSSVAVATQVSGNFILSTHGYQSLNNDFSSFVYGFALRTGDTNLTTIGHIPINNNLNSFIYGKDNKDRELDLFINGLNIKDSNIDLFVNGKNLNIDNINLFIFGYDTVPIFQIVSDIEFFIEGNESNNNNLSLFIKGFTPSLADVIESQEFTYSLDEPISIICDFDPGRTVIIELYQDGLLQSIVSNICTEIGNTGKYVWSIINIPSIPKNMNWYYFRMIDDLSNIVEGTFILIAMELEGERNPRFINDKNKYIRKCIN